MLESFKRSYLLSSEEKGTLVLVSQVKCIVNLPPPFLFLDTLYSVHELSSTAKAWIKYEVTPKANWTLHFVSYTIYIILLHFILYKTCL